MNKVMVRRI